MISWLGGTVRSARDGRVVLDVAGTGYGVFTTSEQTLAAREGDRLELHTTLIVRDDSLTLYGFPDEQQLEVFDLLLGVSGVGPKSALGVLSSLTPDQIAASVHAEDDAPFRRVSGIGPKTAKLIVVQLAGRMAPPRPPAAASHPASTSQVDSVLAALVGLGWAERVAGEAVERVVAESAEADRATVPALLRLTLAHLGPSAPAAARR